MPGSMLAGFARGFARAAVRLYYPTIEVSGRERVPREGPVLFVANHAASLMDPAIVGITARRPVHFLAKAPLFDVPVLGAAMRALGMVPVFRGSDDRSQVGRNLDSLAVAASRLVDGGAVGIFPEGKSHDALKVEKVRTGAARIAQQAVAGGAKGLKIVPLGLNYAAKERFRSAIWVRVGESVDAAEFLKRNADERAAMRELTAEIDRRLKEVVVHLDEAKWEPFLLDLELLLPAGRARLSDPVAVVRQRKRIADAMNHFLATDRPRAESVAASIEQQRARAGAVGLSIRSPVLCQRGAKYFLGMMWAVLRLALGPFPALLGAVHHIVPFLVVRGIASKLQSPGRMTTSLMRLCVGLPLYAAWYVLVWWWMAESYFLPWVAWTWAGLMPFAGAFALGYGRRAREVAGRIRSEVKLLFQPAKLDELRRAQAEVSAQLGGLAKDYLRARPVLPLAPRPFPWKWWAKRLAFWCVTFVAAVALISWAMTRYKNRPLAEFTFPGPDLGKHTPEVLAAQLTADEGALGNILRSVAELDTRAVKVKSEFASGERSYVRQADNDAVRQLLLTYLNCRAAMLRLAWKYQDAATVRDEEPRLRARLLGHAAGVSLYATSMKFVTQFDRSPETVKKFNEAEPLWGIPPNLFDTVHKNLVQSEHRKLLASALRRHDALQADYARAGFDRAAPQSDFLAAIQHGREAIALLSPRLSDSPLLAVVAEARGAGRQAIYDAKSAVSVWIGETKIRKPRRGKPLIQPAQLEQFRSTLKPGDILLERQNWYLSRAFMPGFWAHAALYVGTTNDLVRLGLDKDPRVQQHWKKFAGRDAEGHQHVILEAVPEGVRITTLEHCIGLADYAAVLRPKLSETHIRDAVGRAFSHVGKPYDFEFDFSSTDKLVCTELVYRAYDGDIQFPLVEVLGRKTMPALEIVRKCCDERGKPGAQLEFILFLDGDEKRGRARFASEREFEATLKRPALTWLQ